MAHINTVFLTLVTFTLLTVSTLGQDLTFTINEESGSDKLVGGVSNVTLNISVANRVSLSYFFLTTSETVNLFRLEDTNGTLYTRVNIDRESVCKNYLPVCFLTLKIGAKTAQDFIKSIDVKIIVNDINDNTPIFPASNITVRISEGVTLNASFPIPSAEDLDTGGTNGIQSYEINPTMNTFDLLTTKNLAGNLEVALVVKQSLDREIQDFYVIHILAKDGGSPVKTGSLIATIVLDDINDNRPIFDKSEYNISVDEGLVRGSLVLNIHANDADIGNNGLVSYRISDRFTQALIDFTINVSTGDIKVLRSKLVFQSDFHYSFIVEAYDYGEQPQISQVWVYIYVLDTENSPPEITVSFPNADNAGYVAIAENSIVGTFVAHIFVTDPDAGANGFITCQSLNNYFDVVKFSDASEFTVIVKNNLDREILDMHNVTVVCLDHGSPPQSASVNFQVMVSDCNDNPPVFSQLTYSVKIPENTMSEQIMLQLSASDKDIGKNQEIHYEVRNQDKVVVNAVTGVVSVKPFFDYEISPIVVFEVVAIDGGDVPLTGTASVILIIQDVNDNVPEFLQSQYFFKIEENLSSGTTINQLSAKDLDSGVNGRFTFSISQGQISTKLPFIILPDGTIQSNQELDREEQSQYSFSATVNDHGDIPLSSSVPVTIFVTDTNDNDPNIAFPRKGNQTVSIVYPSSPMDLIVEIEAHDLDFEENGTLQYNIINGNELGLFQMESISGKIFLADNSKTLYHDITVPLSIEVKDNGKVISRSSTATLIINVIYINGTDDLQIGENKFINIVVVVVTVTIFLSGILIAVILIVRTLDKKRKQKDNAKVIEKTIFDCKPALFFLNNNGQLQTEFLKPIMDEGKEKKDASFSLNEEQDSVKSVQQNDLQMTLPDPFKYRQEKFSPEYGADSTLELYDKDTTRLESLKIQKMYLENHDRQQQQQQKQHIHHINHDKPDDSLSESSGEPSSGDSGRGTSEEEMPSTSLPYDNQKMFDCEASSIQYSKLKNQARQDIYNQVSPPIPCRTYKPYLSFNNIQRHSQTKNNLSVPLHRSGQPLASGTNQSSQISQHCQQYPLTLKNIAQNDFPFLSMHHSWYHRWSHEDDDCSTTTSGSYTLQPPNELL